MNHHRSKITRHSTPQCWRSIPSAKPSSLHTGNTPNSLFCAWKIKVLPRRSKRTRTHLQGLFWTRASGLNAVCPLQGLLEEKGGGHADMRVEIPPVLCLAQQNVLGLLLVNPVLLQRSLSCEEGLQAFGEMDYPYAAPPQVFLQALAY